MNQELGFDVVYGMYGKLEAISGRLSIRCSVGCVLG
jgi:hypothetical protein